MSTTTSPRWLVFTVIALGAVVLYMFATPCHLLSTFDSRNYLSAAISFRETGLFLNSDGSYYVYFGPLFPIILSAFKSPERFLVWANPLMILAIAYLIVRLAQRMTTNFALHVFLLVSVMWSVHLLMISVFIWSELFFLLLLTLLIFILTTPHFSNINFTLAIIVAFLLCLQRNAGLFLVAGASLSYVLNKDWQKKIVKAMLLFTGGTAGFLVWNYYVSHVVPSDFETYDHPFFVYFLHNFSFMGASITRAFLPLPFGESIFFLLMILAITILLFDDFKNNYHFRLIAILIVSYLVGMSSLFELDVNDGDRYVVVILPFFLLLVIRCIEIFQSTKTSRVRVLLMVLVCLSLSYPLSRTAKNSVLWRQMSCAIK